MRLLFILRLVAALKVIPIIALFTLTYSSHNSAINLFIAGDTNSFCVLGHFTRQIDNRVLCNFWILHRKYNANSKRQILPEFHNGPLSASLAHDILWGMSGAEMSGPEITGITGITKIKEKLEFKRRFLTDDQLQTFIHRHNTQNLPISGFVLANIHQLSTQASEGGGQTLQENILYMGHQIPTVSVNHPTFSDSELRFLHLAVLLPASAHQRFTRFANAEYGLFTMERALDFFNTHTKHPETTLLKPLNTQNRINDTLARKGNCTHQNQKLAITHSLMILNPVHPNRWNILCGFVMKQLIPRIPIISGIFKRYTTQNKQNDSTDETQGSESD